MNTQNNEKFMRTVRVRNESQPGTLGRLLLAVGNAGGDVGAIRLLHESHLTTVRDITIYTDDEAQMDLVLAAIEANPGSHILAVRDEVLELHQKGKIAIRSRLPVDSLSILRRVYTPGVAEVCLKIAQRPQPCPPVHRHQPHGRHCHRWHCHPRPG